VLAGLSELPLHADVRPGLKRLRAEGTRLCALTNGSVENARALLEGGGADAYIEQYVSADEVHRWKPAPEPYHLAAERCGVAPHDVTLAAVHPWDVDGAKRAGLGAVWVNRRAEAYPEHFLPPDETCSGFQALAERLASAPRVSIAEDSG
jgi:2-haloacid dehalogenase